MKTYLHVVLAVALGLTWMAGDAAAQSVGQPPAANLGFMDPPAVFALPALKDAPGGAVGREAAPLQVIRRAKGLTLDLGSALKAWRGAGPTLVRTRARVDTIRSATPSGVVFRGETASQLNRFLHTTAPAQVRVLSPRLIVDEPVVLEHSGVRLDLGDAILQATPGPAPGSYMLRIENAGDVVVTGGVFSGGRSAILVSRSHDVSLVGTRIQDLQGNGVVVTNAARVIIWGAWISGLARAPIILHGSTSESVVAYNDLYGNVGVSNWDAGVVITDRNVDLASDPLHLLLPDHYGVVVQPIVGRLVIPRRNVVAFNRIAENHASGLYLDGAAEDVIAGNLIQGNAKEGLCLDNGSIANAVLQNTVQQNGRRWGSSDDDLRRDFIIKFGRLPDGSAKAKVPGVSLDNAAYNIVYSNLIDGNYGGGVKMVRTAYYNLVGLNTLVDDNAGESDQFHFFGIELGAATADAPVADLDFTPSHGNLIFSNLIRGRHYAGVFFADGSNINDLFDNTILGAESWAIESASRQDNVTLNNLTNLPSRNIGPGLDPRLPALTAAHFD